MAKDSCLVVVSEDKQEDTQEDKQICFNLISDRERDQNVGHIILSQSTLTVQAF